MSMLLKILGSLPAPPAPAKRDYTGYELRWKMFVFRPAEFRFEAIALGLVGAYLLLYLAGRYINMGRAKATMKPYQNFIDMQFKASRPLVSSGPALHLLYSTGRRNVLCLHSTLSLLPLHDITGLIMHFGKPLLDSSFDTSEVLNFDLTLGMGEEGRQGEGLGVWAVVDKSSMHLIKQNRWDLSFPRLHEAPAMPITHALFAEHSDVSDVLLKTPNVGITELLAKPEAAQVLRYLIVTDQPARRPSKGALPAKFKTRQILLSVHKPSPAQADAVKAWLQVALNIADLLAKPNLLKPEVSRKLIKTRVQVDEDLNGTYAKDLAEDAPKEETAEEKRLAKKRAERSQMSEKEVKRLEELEKRREMRKMQKKQMK